MSKSIEVYQIANDIANSINSQLQEPYNLDLHTPNCRYINIYWTRRERTRWTEIARRQAVAQDIAKEYGVSFEYLPGCKGLIRGLDAFSDKVCQILTVKSKMDCTIVATAKDPEDKSME